MSGSFVAHERNDDERRNGDSLDRNENRIEPKQTSETPDRFIARKPEEAYDRQHGSSGCQRRRDEHDRHKR